MATALPPALRALLDAGTALVRRSSSGRVALHRALAVLPPDIRRAPLRDPEPVAFKDIEKVLKSAWGRPPGKVLAELEREPLHVGAAAQVHRAETDDGDVVALKVLRPGLAAAVRNDLALLDLLATPLGQVSGAMDAGPILRAVREMALDELDLEHEASNQRQARRLLRGVDGLVVPVPDLELSTPDVLVTEYVEGTPLAAGATAPDTAARTLVAAHLAAARGGLVLTDPRPSHVLVRADGTLALLGTGAARPFPRERHAAYLSALAALRSTDQDAFAHAVAQDLQLLPPTDALKAYALVALLADGALTQPTRLDPQLLLDGERRALEHVGAGLALAATVTPDPADLALARSLGQLAATLAHLGTTEDWGELVLQG
jgi:predicted unusual protein kinase regulating ubiquinone biosynthesis (AarF/ABC1/UbiB family)